MTKSKNPDNFTHPHVKPRLTPEQVEMFLAHCLLMPDIFMVARTHLKPELFNAATEPHYKALWQVVLNLVKDKSSSVLFDSKKHAYSLIEVTLRAYVQANPALMPSAFDDKLFSRDPESPGLIYWIYNQVSQEELNFSWGKDLLRDFRSEREVHDKLKKALRNAGESILDNIPEFLQNLRDKQVSIQALDEDPVESGAPENWAPVPMHKFPTNIVWLDPFLKGGHAGKEVYGVLGAFGSGKTAMAMQLVAGGAMYQLEERHKDPGYIPKHWYMFTYEATRDECRLRLWSQQCSVDHHELEEFSWDKMSSIADGYNSLKPYEKEYWDNSLKANPNGLVQGELERINEKLPLFRQNLWIIDMSGVPENPKRGTGYVPEIASIIENDLRKRKEKDGLDHKVGGVAIDYAGLCCKRYINEHNKSYDNLRHFISEFGMKCKQLIAVPQDCPVWVFHQLSGEAQKRTHAVKQHYSDAAETKSFAENLVFCFALGTKDPEYGALSFVCSKARRAEIGPSPLLIMEGKYFRLILADRLERGEHGEITVKNSLKPAVAPTQQASSEEYEVSEGFSNDTTWE